MTALAIGALSACSTTKPPQPTASQEAGPTAGAADVRFPIRSLEANSAQALVINEKDKFDSIASLASQRPTVRREISELELNIIAGDEPGEKVSRMRFLSLPMGLGFFSHTVEATSDGPGFSESGIDLFGLGPVVYWNSRFPYRNGIVAAEPAQFRLVTGRLFSGDSSFTVELKDPSMEGVLQECTPVERIPAKDLHASLTGRATIFACKTGENTDAKAWYLEDYARYVSYDISYDRLPLSKIRIRNVKFQ